ncbi:MAG: ABC transporter substrate-binding protein [Bifidobacteriaceae bacterium]|jgi:ABC-type transport system substrate-binding protein|nr:ABC transporter substrate-binding protein [Bifidobacteriaceae bacterium]
MPRKRPAVLIAALATIALLLAGCSGGGGNESKDNPKATKAKEILTKAGVSTPVELNLQYNGDHYGKNSDQEYNAIKRQLEATGLFKVNLQQTEWVQYSKDRVSDVYPVYQLGWFPDFPDADNYLTPFFTEDNFLVNHFSDPEVSQLLVEEVGTTDPAARTEQLKKLQEVLAQHMPTVPILQGAQTAVTAKDVTGVQETLDASFQFRFAGTQKAGDSGQVVKFGTTDKVTALDPAGSYDNGSYNVHYNVYPYVLGFAPGNPVPTPDLAESCDFVSDGTVYSCKIKPGLKWANGNTLDANDVKFTFDRQVAIAAPDGPSSLLGNLVSVDTPDDLTVNFNLSVANDVTFPQVLASPVGPVVDDQTFSATELVPDEEIVAAKAFGGAYQITSYKLNELIEYTPNPNYQGLHGAPQNAGATVKYYADETNMKGDIEQGAIDVAHRSLAPTDIEALEKGGKVSVLHGPGGEIRYIVFNLETQPGDSAEQKTAIRQAVAASIDRQELATQVYKDTYTPLCSFVPDGLPGASTAVCDAWGK